jgi:hypothetical protein
MGKKYAPKDAKSTVFDGWVAYENNETINNVLIPVQTVL